MKMQSAAIIAVGTEITSGEVVNSNAAWLGERLAALGMEIKSHISVPDNREMMLWAFAAAAQQADLVLITGGLGPTSDDFTRKVVAQWCGCKLQYDPLVFAELVRSLSDRGVKVKPGHRTECEFPEGFTSLPNSVGTARGFFRISDLGPKVVVLPGPPREMQAMVETELIPRLKPHLSSPTNRLRTWILLNLAESDAAELVEKEIAGTDLVHGYRASPPFVRVKVWLPDQAPHPVESRLDEVLQPWLIGYDRFDAARELRRSLLEMKIELRVFDQVTEGIFFTRLAEVEPAEGKLNLAWSSRAPSEELGINEVRLEAQDSQEFRLSFDVAGRRLDQNLRLPYRMQIGQGRGRKAAAELSILQILRALRPDLSPT